MGQVFTWDAIRTGRIPRLESFQRVADILRRSLSSEPFVVSALLFGSVVRGDFNIRSDIDCVVIYETIREGQAVRIMHNINRMAHALHVPINFTPCDTVLARTRLHHLGTSFIRHLQASIDAGGLIKGNLVDLLAPTIPVDQEIESYIKMKMYSMQESLAQMTYFGDEKLAAFLKKALEAPMHVARKMLIYEGTLQGDSKKEVQGRYRETMPSHLWKQFDALLRVDSWYSTELEATIRSSGKVSYYGIVLDGLKQELPAVLEFLRSNILRLNKAR